MPDEITRDQMFDHARRLAADYRTGLSIRMIRGWDSVLDDSVPTFDHVQPEGRDAARRLWRAAFGDPKASVIRIDVLYGARCVAPNTVVKVSS